jgi:hypothetical protein
MARLMPHMRPSVLMQVGTGDEDHLHTRRKDGRRTGLAADASDRSVLVRGAGLILVRRTFTRMLLASLGLTTVPPQTQICSMPNIIMPDNLPAQRSTHSARSV